ncbi:hypothetical protein GCM10029992_04780 [Glycomyces albus]
MRPIPRAVPSWMTARPVIAASTGEVQGIHESAKTAPNTGAPARPTAGRHRGAKPRPSGTSPMNMSPMAIMKNPTTVSSVEVLVSSARPALWRAKTIVV